MDQGLMLSGLPCRHPWVDSAGRLSFPALDRWAPRQSSLAQVVSEATSSLSGQPAGADSSPSPSRSGTRHRLLRLAEAVLLLGMLASAVHGDPWRMFGHPSAGMPLPLQDASAPRNALQGLRRSQCHAAEGTEGSPGGNTPSRAPSVPDLAPQLAAMSTRDLTELLEDEEKYCAFVRREAAKAHIIKVRPLLLLLPELWTHMAMHSSLRPLHCASKRQVAPRKTLATISWAACPCMCLITSQQCRMLHLLGSAFAGASPAPEGEC